MVLLALSASLPFPIGFVAVAVITAALSPPIVYWYVRLGWRIPLWHLFLIVAWFAIALLFGADHVRARHSLDRLYWLYDHGFFGTLNKPTEAQLQDVDYTSTLEIAGELVSLSFVPAVIAIVISFVITKRIASRTNRASAA